MNINVLYFGLIAEMKNCSSEIKQMALGMTSTDLEQMILEEIPSLGSVNYAIAKNQEMISEGQHLNEGDEVAFFPPFAGG